MNNVRDQIEDFRAEREGEAEQAAMTAEHLEARRLLAAQPTQNHREHYATERQPSAEREDFEAGS